MNKEELKQHLSSYGFEIDEAKMNNIEHFIDETLITNEKFNLTGITDKDVFREKMVLDSALGIVDLDLNNKKVIDVGTGAGYPGMIIYLLNPNVKITLLDSTSKKINYLENYAKGRGYHIDFAISRIEEYAHLNAEKYDYVFARAVAALNVLLELVMPMIKVGGYFVALKGLGAEEEIKLSKNAFKKLDCEVTEVKHYVLPESKEERNVILIKKKSSTNKKYPRTYAEIKKSPL